MMPTVLATHAHLADRIAKHGERFMRDLEPAIVERTAGGMRVDTAHPAWAAMLETYGPARPRKRRRPMDPAKGRALWAELHRRAIVEQADAEWLAYLDDFDHRVPCGECKEHWIAARAKRPWIPEMDRFVWTWARHEDVNALLGKRPVTLDDARALWKQQ